MTLILRQGDAVPARRTDRPAVPGAVAILSKGADRIASLAQPAKVAARLA